MNYSFSLAVSLEPAHSNSIFLPETKLIGSKANRYLVEVSSIGYAFYIALIRPVLEHLPQRNLCDLALLREFEGLHNKLSNLPLVLDLLLTQQCYRLVPCNMSSVSAHSSYFTASYTLVSTGDKP